MKTPATISAKEAPAKQAGNHSSAQPVQVPQPVFGAPIVIQRKCACGGECPSCQKEELEESHPIQTNLQVNTPGDAFEREADRIADQVVGMNSPRHGVIAPLPVTPVTTSRAQRKSFESASSAESYAAEESRGRAPPTVSNNRDHLTQTQAAEVVTHLAFYAGWPNAFSALPVLKDVFEKRPR
jgi:hypothetical protein